MAKMFTVLLNILLKQDENILKAMTDIKFTNKTNKQTKN